MILRDYQKEAVDALHKTLKLDNSALCVMSCGLGKTEVMIEYINRHYSPTEQWLVILNRVDLFEQTYKRLKRALINYISAYCASSSSKPDLTGQIVIGTIQSLIKIQNTKFQYIFLDEAHNAAAEVGRYAEFLATQNQAKIIGFTATPFRSDGPIYGEGKLFREITFKKALRESINQGWLVPPKCKTSNEAFDLSTVGVVAGEWSQGDLAQLAAEEKKVREQVEDALSRISDRKKIVWFCCNINHAELVCRILRETESASLVHSKLSKEERAENKNRFEQTACRHLSFVTIVSEGYDYPPVDCVVMMRPTRSAVLYVQTVGRAMRLSPGKTDCLVLDYGRIIEHLGPLDNPLVLDSKRKKADKQIEELKEKTKFCPECFSYLFAPFPAHCPDCGFEFPKPTAKIESKPEEVRDILTNNDWQIHPIRSVVLDRFKSKAGNTFFRAKYFQFPNKTVTCVELLNADPTHFSYSKTLRRLRELEVDLEKAKTTPWGTSFYKAERIPSEICFRINMKGFSEVKWIDFETPYPEELENVGEGN